MKNLVFKDTLREIRKTKSRYFSIFAIVFIGVAFFSGILAIGPDMRYSVDDYYDDYHLMDVRVVSTLGITEDDVKELKKIEELEEDRLPISKNSVGKIADCGFWNQIALGGLDRL